MITIQFNDENMMLENDYCLTTALAMRGPKNDCYAVAINRQFIPRSNYENTILNEGDVVEIISPMQGG